MVCRRKSITQGKIVWNEVSRVNTDARPVSLNHGALMTNIQGQRVNDRSWRNVNIRSRPISRSSRIIRSALPIKLNNRGLCRDTHRLKIMNTILVTKMYMRAAKYPHLLWKKDPNHTWTWTSPIGGAQSTNVISHPNRENQLSNDRNNNGHPKELYLVPTS